MKRLLFAIVLILSTCLAQAADKHVLVVNDSGYYLMVTPDNAAPRFEKIDVVIDVTKNGGGPTTPSDPGTPTEDPIVQGAYDAAKSVGNKKDAEVLGAVYTFFAEKLNSGEMDEEGLRKHFTTVRAVAERRLTGDWGAALKQFDEGQASAQNLAAYFDKIGRGLTKFAGTTPEAALAEDREDITGMEIIALIEAIMQLLKLLGVLK